MDMEDYMDTTSLDNKIDDKIDYAISELKIKREG